MRIGLTAYDMTGTELLELARAADELGFHDLWLGEHIVLPWAYSSEHPTTGTQAHRPLRGAIIDPATRLVDPLVALSAMAAATRRLRLATGIYILTLRHPLVTARMAATLHDVSGGRFALGVGSGWLEEEFAALGVPFLERRSRYEECLSVLRAAWAGGPFANDGPHFPFGLVQVSGTPLPIPLILGGNSEAALQRAAAVADGWFASGTPDLDDARRLRDRVTALYQRTGRTAEFPTWFRVPGADETLLERYRAEGFEHVLVWAHHLWPRRAPADPDADGPRLALAEAAHRFGLRGR